MTVSSSLDDRAGWLLLDRYVAGECAPAESAAMAAWLAKTPSAADVAATMREIRVDPAVEHLVVDVARMAAAVWPDAPATIGPPRSHFATPAISRPVTPPLRPVGAGGLRIRPLLAGAAALAALVAGVLHRAHQSSPPVLTRAYMTQGGQTAAIQLPDGSRVTLAPETNVRYEALRDGSRIIQLEGQARFEVTHDAARTFTVRTRVGQVRVLGTSFDVRRYATDRVTDVVVLSGRVSAEHASHARVISAGMMAQMTDSSVTSMRVDAGPAGADWINGRLVFKKVPVPVMLATLSRWYGYEFRLADSVLITQAVTLELPTDQPAVGIRLLEDVLNASLTFSEKDKVVIVRHRTTRAGGAPTRNVRTSPLIPMTEAGK